MLKVLRNKKGFTLVELLVVVIILAVLAAIVIPQLRSSSQEAKVAALDTDLSSIRSAIELYYHQHNNTYPGVIMSHDGTGHADEEEAFVKQLTYCSSANGNTTATCSATTYGPYLKKAVPKNPLPNNATTTDVQAAGVNVNTAILTLGTATASDATAKGWFFVRQTGEFFANNTFNGYSSR
ncbi:MAG: prepilin-type N-terminal cleavage/methylation domain-containing protein [Nitrospirae bacterium]|nr:prepilin-type N-terminal cleavage/methylation domain-containing protein [Nitrospirota bacterium]